MSAFSVCFKLNISGSSSLLSHNLCQKIFVSILRDHQYIYGNVESRTIHRSAEVVSSIRERIRIFITQLRVAFVLVATSHSADYQWLGPSPLLTLCFQAINPASCIYAILFSKCNTLYFPCWRAFCYSSLRRLIFPD